MWRSWRLPLATVLLAAGPVLAVAELSADDLAANRRLLAQWRADPDHYARLKRDYQALMALPPERLERMRKLDRDLRALDPVTQARLWKVMERYSAWLERLPDADRRRIEEAADSDERLHLIKELREREWIAHLPKVDQVKVNATPAGPQREHLLAQLRQEEKTRRHEFLSALAAGNELKVPPLKPTRLEDFPPEVQEYVTSMLLPRLTEYERGEFKGNQGKWPDFGRKVVEMAKKHPILLPPGNFAGPTTIIDLPPVWLRHLKMKNPEPPLLTEEERVSLRQSAKKWPEFALAVYDVAKEKGWMMPAHPLGPCKPEDFVPAVQRFITETLAQKLDTAEKKNLKDAEGKWPDYPKLVMELAEKKGLQVPGTFLPGSKEFWAPFH
jgi:hypothetical protein